ncbi:hypothetical protein MPL3356_10002 [Mesorhizobium plurifarium]|uniref:Uncharacterized protein n=1 Tax=Mesorhizobium plurifarium TaxID=69974 RepID=A0A090DDF7_MESPL|nr:hypothetical protein MPL3356_10002 [Mesorhizobium plurifarium]
MSSLLARVKLACLAAHSNAWIATRSGINFLLNIMLISHQPSQNHRDLCRLKPDITLFRNDLMFCQSETALCKTLFSLHPMTFALPFRRRCHLCTGPRFPPTAR